MGRPKIKTIESDFDIEKVKLPEDAVVETESKQPKVGAKEARTTQAKAKSKPAKANPPAGGEKKKPSKRYTELLKLIDKNKLYMIEEAVGLIKKSANTKFDATIEAHINLQIDPSKQEQQIRTTVTLPKGNGKKINILVFGAKDTKAVKDAGATVGTEDSLTEIEKGKITFQKVVASPEWMPKLAKVAKILGPKGLMPNPKSGTVSAEPEKVAASLNSGMVEIKTETSPIVHVTIGKASFKESDLEENVKSLLESVKAAKPADMKKELVKSIFLTSTMGPSVKLDISNLN